MTRAARTWCSPNLITHVATTDATVTGNQMTTAICEDLTRQNLAPGRSYLDSGYLSAAVVVSALTTRAAPGSLEGCDLWESRDSWHHGGSIPRAFLGEPGWPCSGRTTRPERRRWARRADE
jgi:hypothetical protein